MHQREINQMINLNLTISIITLNVNGLNISIKKTDSTRFDFFKKSNYQLHDAYKKCTSNTKIEVG